jgi:hypothetical protein
VQDPAENALPHSMLRPCCCARAFEASIFETAAARRRGAAFGLAGVVKGLGIASLKGYGIMDALKAGVENKNEATAREGERRAHGR